MYCSINWSFFELFRIQVQNSQFIYLIKTPLRTTSELVIDGGIPPTSEVYYILNNSDENIIAILRRDTKPSFTCVLILKIVYHMPSINMNNNMKNKQLHTVGTCINSISSHSYLFLCI